MSERIGRHPTDADLEAFALGDIDSAVAQAIEEHVGVCACCCASLQKVPDDALIARLRWAATFAEPPDPHTQETTAPLPAAVPCHDASTLLPLESDQTVVILDPATGRSVELRSSEDVVELGGKGRALRLSTDTLLIRRGQKTIVEVRRGRPPGKQPPGAVATATDPSP